MRRRILATILLVTTLAVLAFFVPAMLAMRSRIQRNELLQVQREASIIATGMPPSGPIDVGAVKGAIDPDHDLAFYDITGALVLGNGPGTPDRIVRLGLEGTFAEGYVRGDLVAAVPVRMTAVGPQYVVRISEPRAESDAQVRNAILLLALVAVGVILVAGIIGALLARRLCTPIERLRRWASTIGRQSTTPPPPTGIGEIDELGAALTDADGRIRDLLRRERSFSSHVSHQLRTPVAAMRVAIETELDAPRDDRTVVLQESLRALDRLESTIDSMLALARHDKRAPAWCDVGALARDHAERWRPSYAAVGRDITVQAPTQPGEVDAAAVGHILDVLLENALVHGRGPVAVNVRRSGPSIEIDVGDEGPSNRASDPFSDGSFETSHGIGLRLARTLAESEGGQLQLLEVAPTVYRLSLPLPA